MLRSFISLCVIASASSAVACAPATEPDAAVSVRLPRTNFSRETAGHATISYSLSNDGTTSVRVTSSCGDDPAPTIQQLVNRRWIDIGGGVCLAINSMGTLTLSGGAAHQSSVTVVAPGEYRLVVPTTRGNATSTSFTVD